MNRKKSVNNNGAKLMIYGKHASLAAIENASRTVHHAYVSRNLHAAFQPYLAGVSHSVMELRDIEKMLPEGAVHQGIVLEVAPLEPFDLEDVINDASLVVVLDQVSDPHNVGAIMRTCAAFGVDALIVHDRHAPKESSIIAKAACGALEMLPLISVTNIVYGLDELKEAGFWCVGLAGEASQNIADFVADKPEKIALILGAEGDGMRRLTAEKCDFLVRLPIHPQMESLNVSNAAAIALYALQHQDIETNC
jgi:23S rRNA (guanosine2251-2'-O)-methyltransferase